MSAFIRNLLAAFRGRRAQASITSVVQSFESAAQQLAQAQQHIYRERQSISTQIDALYARDNELTASRAQAVRVAAKLREFTA